MDTIKVIDIKDGDARRAGWWISSDQQGEMDMTGATLAEAKREMLAQCATDEERDGIMRGSIQVLR